MAASFAMTIGARGFQHPGWWGTYYPGDLPEEWRLPFYCNQYRAVLIPQNEWSARSPAFWEEAVENDLACFLEQPADGDPEALRAHARALGGHLKGLVGDGDLSSLGLDVPVFAWTADAAGGGGVVWQGPGEEAVASERTAVGLLDVPEGADARALREALESFHHAALQADAVTSYLFFAGDPPPVGVLGDARTLVSLLGWSPGRQHV